MLGGLGLPELVIILVIILIIFGTGKLPEIGGSLGKGIRNFRKASSGSDEIDVTPKADEEAAGAADAGKKIES
ncbi:MAG: twin-arginine translocase TatA/TatE family subunit [Deltaproteobacteria bacterium]|nr:twin-arginine translocase TatA/TatE family subunit [Candidatus Anaeroferrophillacea bacterium]